MAYREDRDILTLRRQAQKGSVILFLGSGLSYPLFPSWTQLAEDLRRLLNTPDRIDHKWPLDQQFEALRKTLGSDFDRELYKKFCAPVALHDISSNYRFVRDLGIYRIVTTNYDRIPQVLWPDVIQFCATDEELRYLSPKEPFVLKLHGTPERPSTLVITQKDYDNIILRPQVHDFLNALFRNDHVLFIGFGLSDRTIDRVLERHRTVWENSAAFATVPDLDERNYQRLKSCGIVALGYDTDGDDHRDLQNLLGDIFERTEHQDRKRGRMTPSAMSQTVRSEVTEVLQKAFPLSDRTRLIYTCRYGKEREPVKCPGVRADPGSHMVHRHTPTDELQLEALCETWYAEHIFSSEGKWVVDAVCCSASVEEVDAVCDGRIDERLLDNLIVIGENPISTRLMMASSYFLPWRHVREGRAVYLQLSEGYEHAVKDMEKAHLRDRKYFSALLTYAPNPYAPGKKVLYLVGCRRAGQDMLCSWLVNSAAPVLRQVSEEKHLDVVQVVVCGATSADAAFTGEDVIRGRWETSPVDDISGGRRVPYFVRRRPEWLGESRLGELVCDLSLVAMISGGEEWVCNIRNELPESLCELYRAARASDDGGMHVTLFEFLHQRGSQDLGLVRKIVQQESPFVSKLRKLISEFREVHLVARQARATEHGLQVLIEVDARDLPFWWEKLRETCIGAAQSLAKGEQVRFNVCDVPVPLHTTLLRFNGEVTLAQRELARYWAERHRRTVWGMSEKLDLQLAVIQKFPYEDVQRFRLLE